MLDGLSQDPQLKSSVHNKLKNVPMKIGGYQAENVVESLKQIGDTQMEELL